MPTSRSCGATAARVWDDAGREYLDFVAGIAVVGLGHCAPAPLAAAQAQLDRLWHASNLYWTEPMLRLAALLGERFEGGSAFFCNSGAEANEAALKIARKATGGPGSSRSRAASTAGRSARSPRPASRGSGRASARSSPASRSRARTTSSRSRRRLLPRGDTALILLEPVLGEGGVIPLEPAFAQAAAELALEVGALLCVDEVQAGMGRTGTFFAYEQLGITPDLVTLAKGLANGLPMGALLAGERAAPGFVPGDHGSTFGGNPVVAAAACAVVEAIDDELLANVRERGAQLEAGLAALPAVRSVRGRGLLIGAELDRPVGPVVDACREQGLLVLSAGPDVLRLTPPLVVDAAQVAQALAILEGVLAS